MVTAVHTLIYSDDAPATRAFLRDVLGWPYIADAGTDPGWLIFKTGPSEMGVHPTFEVHEGKEYRAERHHSVSLMCDDVAATMRELGAKGAEFRGEPRDFGWGIGVMMALPGADDVFLYQPKHPKAYDM